MLIARFKKSKNDIFRRLKLLVTQHNRKLSEKI